MDKTVAIVSAIVGPLGVLSAILGFSAEGTKIIISDVLLIGDECLYPQNPSFALGICAAIFLLMAQITVTAVGGCCGCCKSRAIPSETKRIVGIVCAVVSWIAAGVAWVLFVVGAAWNANVARDTAPDGIFAGAAVLALAATALGIASYVTLRGQRNEAVRTPKPGEQQPTPAAGIAMGHPAAQLSPPVSAPPAPPQQGGDGRALNPQPQVAAAFPAPAQVGSHAPDQPLPPHPPPGDAQV
ncbi:Os05g0435100 [Oryza sativa Japonica Group]|uniref:Os05g0435100 protein n=1 Tax=Oryza sativa subsp. japonica TaxID=39947 RepID=Q0DHW8_ORYSJ|nr:Os05g0435100 [Oryza sativa Japonica Group]|eukprot:NP_001055641.2 Os05g0435100 [Oryza sativa Japonica Group]